MKDKKLSAISQPKYAIWRSLFGSSRPKVLNILLFELHTINISLFEALFVYNVKSNIEISISNSNVHKNCLNKPQNDQKCENRLYGFWLIFTNNVFLLICIEIKVSEIEILSEMLEELDVDNKMFTIFCL